jgi:hypothetical protein
MLVFSSSLPLSHRLLVLRHDTDLTESIEATLPTDLSASLLHGVPYPLMKGKEKTWIRDVVHAVRQQFHGILRVYHAHQGD